MGNAMKVAKKCIALGALYGALLALCTSCENDTHVDGAYEESPDSGRILNHYPEIQQHFDNYRFFRFYLRQYGDDVGGIFETFDLPSYFEFSQMPEAVESRMSSYYCARIESGYVRNGYVNLYFIDKEQRRWLYTGAISETIEGSIHRVSQSDGSKISSRDYLMPQDAAYYQHSSNSTKQMVLAKRDKEPTNPLSCIYYYKGVDIDFLIPESVWNHCNDPALCHNLRLAIIGMKPIPNWLDSKDTKPIVAEFLSATLSDVDRVGTARTIYMRDTPHVKFRNSSGMFWATAIVYDDANGNGIWDHDEIIYAGMQDSLLLFLDESSPATYLAQRPNTDSHALYYLYRPKEAQLGWQVVGEKDQIVDNSAFRAITSLDEIRSLAALSTWNDDKGCVFEPSNDDNTAICRGMLPFYYSVLESEAQNGAHPPE